MENMVYIRMRYRVHVHQDQNIQVKNIAKVLGPEQLVKKVEEIFVHQVSIEDKTIVIIDLSQMLARILESMPGLEVQTFGPTQTIVEIIYDKRKVSYLAVTAVWLLLFFGTALTIMNYHEDVSMQDVHQKLFKIITGREDSKPLLIQIPYSFGLGLGMILFFNHFFRKRFNEEPSPLEVEIFNYQQDLDQFMIMNENKESVKQLDER
ncbi:stage V sporulation protein AA [Peribacillus saganii]|uniref:Stage V sporulation protein AA n=1 Tax=Peribacillus saganii TaxID=2303992 RepID=A0A372LMQ1_9BACI|nr:stage V sporulation protein AA [Peribacillus saganii]RFU67782.1 stage V sporulation protein AA [Peribacillus saganii]